MEIKDLRQVDILQMCQPYCEKYNINALYIEDGDHSLEVKGELDKNIDILKQVMQFVDEKYRSVALD